MMGDPHDKGENDTVEADDLWLEDVNSREKGAQPNDTRDSPSFSSAW